MFHRNPFSGSRVDACGQADRHNGVTRKHLKWRHGPDSSGSGRRTVSDTSAGKKVKKSKTLLIFIELRDEKSSY